MACSILWSTLWTWTLGPSLLSCPIFCAFSFVSVVDDSNAKRFLLLWCEKINEAHYKFFECHPWFHWPDRIHSINKPCAMLRNAVSISLQCRYQMIPEMSLAWLPQSTLSCMQLLEEPLRSENLMLSPCWQTLKLAMTLLSWVLRPSLLSRVLWHTTPFRILGYKHPPAVIIRTQVWFYKRVALYDAVWFHLCR